ncbi:MAG TPA: CAP domain-containing protein [Candidatus Levybacteria bacterium]|nr:CAP domain-containing protein [Candidatus Levybacteria bacterium]
MNSRTIHGVLLVSAVAFLITGSRVYAQTQTQPENQKTDVHNSQSSTTHDAHISSQLPILSSDVGETLPKKEVSEKKSPTKSPDTTTPTSKESQKTTPTPSASPSPEPETTTPTQQPVQAVGQMTNTGGLDPEKLFSMSNEYRKSKGLPEFKKDEKTCALAQSRAPEVAAEVTSGDMHKGLRDRNLDYWNTENIISMRTEESAFNWWVNDKIHHDAIVGNFTYSCVACSGNSCAQEFTNYQPK